MNLSNDDRDLIDDNYYGVENVGGINLSTSGNFELNIERKGDGLRFQLSQVIIDRLKQTGMGHLQPNVMFVKHIDRDRLEISDSSDLSTILQDISDERTEVCSKPQSDSQDGLVARVRQAWKILRGFKDSS